MILWNKEKKVLVIVQIINVLSCWKRSPSMWLQGSMHCSCLAEVISLGFWIIWVWIAAGACGVTCRMHSIRSWSCFVLLWLSLNFALPRAGWGQFQSAIGWKCNGLEDGYEYIWERHIPHFFLWSLAVIDASLTDRQTEMIALLIETVHSVNVSKQINF